MKKHYILFVLLFLVTNLLVQSQEKFTGLDEYKLFKQDLMQKAKYGFENHAPAYFNTRKNTKSFADFGGAPDFNWASAFGGSGYDQINAVVTDSEGNIYSVGSFSGQVENNGVTYSAIGKRDAVIAKFDNTGNLVWFDAATPQAFKEASAYGICIDANDNIYVTGYFTGDISIGDYTLTGASESSVFVAKISPQDEVLMAFSYNYNENGMGLKIDTDADGNIYVVSSQYVTANFRHTSLILKFDASGNLVWEQSHDESFSDLVISATDIYFTGTRQSGDDGVLDNDVSMDFPVSYGDAFVAKATLDGDFTWAVMAGHDNSGDSHAEDIAVDASGNILITGSYRGSVGFGTDMLYNSNGFIAKFSPDSSALWLKDFGEVYNTNVYDLTADNDDNIFITYDNISFTNNIALKYDADGNLLMSINGGDKTFSAITISAAGKIVIGGNNNGLIFSEQQSETGTNEWNFQFSGTSALSWTINSVTDNSGHVYVYAYASNEIDYFGQTVHKGIFLAKQKGNGDIIWLKEFNDVYARSYVGRKLVIDPAKEFIYIVGLFETELSIPGGSTLTPVDGGSIFITKYATDGTYQWTIKEDFGTDDLCLTADYSGNLIFSGVFNTPSISISGHNLTGIGLEVFVAKYDASGNNLWAMSAGGDNHEYIGVISTDQENNIYLTGEFDSENQHIGDYTFTLAEGDGNVLLAKINPEGVTQWAKAFAGSTIAWGDWYCWATDIVTDADGFSYIKGWHGDSVYFDDYLLTTHDLYGYFNCKIDSDGNVVWVNSINEKQYGFDYNQMDLDDEGNLYLGAQARDTIWFADDFEYVPLGVYDLFIAKYTSDGTLSWVKAMESSDGYNWLSSVSVYNSSSIFVGGYFNDYIKAGTSEFTSTNTNGFITLLGDDIVKTNEVYNKNNQGISFFPNPSTGLVKVNVKDLNNNTVDINIVNITGQVIVKQTIKANQLNNIDLSYLEKGVYFIQTTNQAKTYARKLIIN